MEQDVNIYIPMDPAVPSERKWDWGMMTRGLSTFSDSVWIHRVYIYMYDMI